MNKFIRTLKYGDILVRYGKTYTFNEVLDLIEMCDETQYEVRRNFNGELVAIKIEEE